MKSSQKKQAKTVADSSKATKPGKQKANKGALPKEAFDPLEYMFASGLSEVWP